MSALDIKNPDVAAKARRLAKLKNLSITDAISEALSESLLRGERNSAAERQARIVRTGEIVGRFQEKLGPKPAFFESGQRGHL